MIDKRIWLSAKQGSNIMTKPIVMFTCFMFMFSCHGRYILQRSFVAQTYILHYVGGGTSLFDEAFVERLLCLYVHG